LQSFFPHNVISLEIVITTYFENGVESVRLGKACGVEGKRVDGLGIAMELQFLHLLLQVRVLNGELGVLLENLHKLVLLERNCIENGISYISKFGTHEVVAQ